jgi:hypothetical protein
MTSITGDVMFLFLNERDRGRQGKVRQKFFFEKKNQKTFIPLMRAAGERPGSKEKSFLLLFFKKEALS